ncbi:MAG: type IV pilus secretin PilQ [Pseudomonadota bacterium]
MKQTTIHKHRLAQAAESIPGFRPSGDAARPSAVPFGAVIALTLGLGLHAAWAENVIQGMNVTNTPDGGMQIRFTLATPPQSAPSHFSIEQPSRIALDFQDTKLGLDKRFQSIESSAVNDVRFAESGGRTRAVIGLKGNAAYDIKTEGQDVILAIQPESRQASMEAASTQQPLTDTVDAAEVDFRRGSQGEGRLVVKLARPNVPMTMNAEGRRLIIDLPQTRLTAEQYDVADFATPVSKVSVQQRGAGSRLIVETSAPFDKLAYQADNQLTVEVRPLPKEQPATAGLGPKTYQGERLTLKFQDIEIRPLLQLLADFTGNNIVVSDSVQGRMSLRLENVPWDQAMDLILTTKGLSQRKSGNVIFVAPTAEITAREKAEMEARKQSEDLAPLMSEFMQVNYAKASDIAKLLRPTAVPGAAAPVAGTTGTVAARQVGFLSPRGTLTVDERTNTLLVNDTPDSLDKIRDLVKKLDTPIKQVLIESRIVIATDDFSRELGLKWGVTGAFNTSGDPILLSGNATGTGGMATNIGSGSAPGVPSLGDRFNINMPAGSFTGKPVSGSLGLAVLGSNVLVDLELQALQVEGKGEIVSSPRVITANGQKATIKQGKEIPYLEQTSSGATNIEFKEAVLATEVTPQITPNNDVIMDIKVQKDEPDFTRSINGVPPIDKREVNTKVQVQNGETVVLGGIYEISSADQINKIPFLGDLPILGHLFKTNGTKSNKFELIIFVTPRIVENGVMVNPNN